MTDETGKQIRAALNDELGFYPASVDPESVARYRREAPERRARTSELSASDKAIRDRITELSVHIPCGGLRGPQPTWRWQSCTCEDIPQVWEGYDVSRARDLCIICFRDTAGGPSKYAWQACEHCRDVNTAIQHRSGVRPFALGRHSLMNGIGIRGGMPENVVDEQIAKLVEFVRGNPRLQAWRDSEYPRLAASFDPLADIPLPAWQEQWVPSLDASWDAFSRLIGFSLPLDVDVQ
jgi:hypothetical protein